MCRSLNIVRSTYYYEATVIVDESELENKTTAIFYDNHDVCGTRKIKKKLQKSNYQISRCRIGKIMKKLCLVSKYTVVQFKCNKQPCNENAVKNEFNRNFNRRSPFSHHFTVFIEKPNNILSKLVYTAGGHASNQCIKRISALRSCCPGAHNI